MSTRLNHDNKNEWLLISCDKSDICRPSVCDVGALAEDFACAINFCWQFLWYEKDGPASRSESNDRARTIIAITLIIRPRLVSFFFVLFWTQKLILAIPSKLSFENERKQKKIGYKWHPTCVLNPLKFNAHQKWKIYWHLVCTIVSRIVWICQPSPHILLRMSTAFASFCDVNLSIYLYWYPTLS